MELPGLEYDPFLNRYFPLGHHTKKEAPRKNEPVKIHNHTLIPPKVSVFKTRADRVKMFDDGMYEISENVCRKVKLQEIQGQLHCGLPVSRRMAGVDGFLFSFTSLGSFKDWTIFHHDCYFAGEGGIWTDQAVLFETKNSSVFQLFKSRHGDSLICCSADLICRFEDTLLSSPLLVLRDGGFTSAVEVGGNRLLVASTGGRLKIYGSDGRVEKLMMSDKGVAFKKMTLLSDNNSVLAQSFSNQLHLIDLSQMAHMGLLFEDCSQFTTNGDRLVLISSSKTGRVSLYDYTDPTDCIMDFFMTHPPMTLEYACEDNQFIVIVKEE